MTLLLGYPSCLQGMLPVSRICDRGSRCILFRPRCHLSSRYVQPGLSWSLAELFCSQESIVRIDEPIARAGLHLADTDGSPIMAVPVAFSAQTAQLMAAQGAHSVDEHCQKEREKRRRKRKGRSASDAASSTPSKGLPEGWVHQKDPSGR